MHLIKLFVIVFSFISLSHAEQSDTTNKKVGSSRKWGSYGSIYLMSQATTETLTSGDKISSFNMSPFSLSLTNSYRLEREKQLLWTFYGTHYLKVKITSETGEASLTFPIEYGFNFYYRQTLKKYPLISLFAGLDFESFSFFDTDAYINDTTDMHFNRFNIYFASLGISRTFIIKKNIVNLKGVLSHTLTSSSNALVEDKLKGMKYQLNASLRAGADSFLFYSAFLNHYNLDHTSNAKTSNTRIGLGVSYFIQ